MKTLSLVVLALILAGCSQKPQDGHRNAADVIPADPGATMNSAVQTTTEASDVAFGTAGRSIDRAGNAASASAGNVADRPPVAAPPALP